MHCTLHTLSAGSMQQGKPCVITVGLSAWLHDHLLEGGDGGFHADFVDDEPVIVHAVWPAIRVSDLGFRV